MSSESNRDSLPTVAPTEFTSGFERRDATTRGILLAAGTSSRYGAKNKLLASLDGTPLVRHAALTLLESDVDDVTVILGYQSDEVREAVADLDVTFRENPAYDDGQSTSVRQGVLSACEHGVDAALVALGDMPRIEPRSVNLVVEAYERGIADIVTAGYRQMRGNPVLFDARFFDELVDVEGDTGGRRLLQRSESAVAVETGDPGVLRDVDSPTDLTELA